MQTPSEPTLRGHSCISPLCILCPCNSCGGLPCSSLPIISSQTGLITLMEWERWPVPEHHGTQVQTGTFKVWRRWRAEAPTLPMFFSPRCCRGRRGCTTCSRTLSFLLWLRQRSSLLLRAAPEPPLAKASSGPCCHPWGQPSPRSC